MKVEVQDDNGYDKSRVSAHNYNAPVTKAVFSKFSVPINSFDRNMNNIRSSTQEESAILSDLHNYRELRAFLESSKAIQHLVSSQGNTVWYDHTVTLYVRFDSNVLQTKSCQLQVSRHGHRIASLHRHVFLAL